MAQDKLTMISLSRATQLEPDQVALLGIVIDDLYGIS
jgi:hypothetical protein